MNPSRGGKARHARARKTLPNFFDPSSHPQDAPEAVTPAQSPNPPAHRTPQTAPQDRKGLSSKARSFTSGFTSSDARKFSTPSPATSSRKRSRTTEFADATPGDDAEASNQKGGHSLRKRARIDYSFEYIDDELGGRSRAQAQQGRSASRGRKRADDEGLEASGPRRRATESWRGDTSPRRKNPARKTAEFKSYAELADEKDVLDTIEVGGRVQPDESPEQGEDRRRDELDSSPSPRGEEPERFIVDIPLPASLRGLGLSGLTRSPEVVETKEGLRAETREEPKEETRIATPDVVAPVPALVEPSANAENVGDKSAPEEAPAPAIEPSVEVEEAGEKAVPEEAGPAPVVEPSADTESHEQKAVVTEEPAPAPVAEPSAATETHSAKAASPAPAPRPEEVEPPKEEAPAEAPSPTPTRRNSAPGVILPMSVGAGGVTPEVPTRPWKEFEDVSPSTVSEPLKPIVEEEPVRETEAAQPVEDVNAAETSDVEMADATIMSGTIESVEPVEPETAQEPVEPESAKPASTELEPEAGTNEPESHPEPAEPGLAAQEPTEPEIQEPEITKAEVESPEADTSIETQKSPESEAVPASETTPLELTPPAADDTALSVEDQLPQGTKVHTIIIETEQKPKPPAEVEPPPPTKPWSHLTPHLAGQWTMHPESRLPQSNAARASIDSKGSATPSSKPSAVNGDATVNGEDGTPQEPDEDADEPSESAAVSPRVDASAVGSPVPELNHATAASSPAAPDEDDGPEEVEEDATTEEPPPTQRFYKYPRLRDPDEFNDVIQHYKDMSTSDLYEMCGFVDKTLLALQEEYLMLGTIVDDYENVERRRAHDEANEQLERRGDKVSRKTFVLKGYRAPMTAEEKETAYQRHQDRVQAAAYGFRYDSHQAKVGRQDPVLQRLRHGSDDGEPRRTLRSDPLRSAKATEAADEGGKRIRRQREIFDPVASRGSTPVPRRRRGKAGAEVDEDAPANGVENGHVNGVMPVHESTGKRGRGRKREAEEAGAAMAPPPVPKRVRRASTKAQMAAAEEHAEYEPHTSVFPATPEIVESVETPKRGQRIVTLKTKAGSFGALAARAVERPGSASSTGSEGEFGRKKGRKSGGGEEEEWEEAKGKRARKVTKKARESGVEGMLVLPSQEDVVDEEGKARKPRIKVVKSGTGAVPAEGGAVGVVQPAANGTPTPTPKARKTMQKAKKVEEGQGELSAQEYAALSKSEKMSHSMKSEYPPNPLFCIFRRTRKLTVQKKKGRWASGSMQQAVDKRKATLAKKKAAKAAGPPGEGSPEGNPEEGREGSGSVPREERNGVSWVV